MTQTGAERSIPSRREGKTCRRSAINHQPSAVSLQPSALSVFVPNNQPPRRQERQDRNSPWGGMNETSERPMSTFSRSPIRRSKRRIPGDLGVMAVQLAACLSRAKEFHEAILDLLVPLLQFLGIHLEKFQIAKLRFVLRVPHLRVPCVESFAVCQDLLHLPGEGEVGEELGRVRMRGEAGDRRGRDDEGDTLLRVDDLDRVPLLLSLVEEVLGPIHRDGSLSRGDYLG